MTAIDATTLPHDVDARESVRECPVCDGRRVTPLRAMRFILPEGHPLPEHYDVVACTTCGAVFADTPAPQSTYGRYYADLSKYSDARTSTGAGTHAWDDARLERTARTIADFLPDRSARVLDLGCANGGLLRWFGRLGFARLEGIDPSTACVDAVNTIPNAVGRAGSLFDLPPEAAGADCVILSHVLEHVRDVRRAVSVLRDVLGSDGVTYVEVPDATRYDECLVAPFQDFNVEHINHFWPTSLANVLERGGFRVEQVGRKTIEASAGVPYPALWAVARVTSPGGANGDKPIERDEALTAAICSYIAHSLEQVSALDAYLDRALAGVEHVVVWGTGQTTLMLLTSTRLGGARIAAFTDSNPLHHGKRLGGCPVVEPEQVAGIDAPILIGSVIHARAIEARIRELGLPNRVVALEAA